MWQHLERDLQSERDTDWETVRLTKSACNKSIAEQKEKASKDEAELHEYIEEPEMGQKDLDNKLSMARANAPDYRI